MVIGHNGAGKTTTIKIRIMGILDYERVKSLWMVTLLRRNPSTANHRLPIYRIIRTSIDIAVLVSEFYM